MMLGNMHELFGSDSCLQKVFLGVSDSIVWMELLCSYVVHSVNGSASRYGGTAVYTVDAIVIGLTLQLV